MLMPGVILIKRSPACSWRIITGVERHLFYRRTPMTLTYRGVAYDSQSALLTHLLDKFKKEQRLEKELKKDRERLAAGPSI